MGQSIVEIRTFGEALRNTGYKSIDNAIAEIVDNSIEANAKNTFIILSEGVNLQAKRKVKCIHEIAFLDNGNGMDDEVLGKCLGYGIGTRYERKGMGRFGVGLPQASMYACPRVEVYSWQSGIDNCKKVYLDIREVTDGTQTEIEEPINEMIPQKYLKYLKYKCGEEIYDFKEHGTLVIWKNCDRVKPKQYSYLKDVLDFSLGQKFRYFISEGKHTIRIINDSNEENSANIKPNDPMFLLEDNCILGNPDNPGNISPQKENFVPLFEPYRTEEYPDGEIDFPVKYWDRKIDEVKDAIVKIRFSKIKNDFYDQNAFPGGNPGGSDMGKYVDRLQGISIIRAGREIDFGKFDYYDNQNKPTHRWWGCEIVFTPELDEAFGVANNKQYVELKKVAEKDYFDEEVQPMWIQLRNVVKKTIDRIVKENEKVQKNARAKKRENSPAEDIVKDVEHESGDDVVGSSVENRNATDEKELEMKIRNTMTKLGVENPTQEDIEAFKNSKIKIIYENGRRGPFLDYDFSMGVACIYINMEHDFYKSFLVNIIDDVSAKTAFELFIAAFVKAIDKTGEVYKEAYDRLMTDWEDKLKKYISAQLNPRS